MKQWYANELSKLTQVSVRTLHHYDKIGLLKPSLRLRNRYRLYSERDLLKLQQIIALKFFGFQLSQIKLLLADDAHVFDHFEMQAQFLQKKSATLAEASSILKQFISSCSDKKSIPWEKIIQIIEVYNMTQQLENSWVKEILDPEELKQYAKFEENLKARSSEEDKARFENNWFELVNKIKLNLSNDPRSEIGITLGQQCMEMVNGLYGKENYNLRRKIWENGFQKGKQLDDHALTPEIVAWLDKAIDAYWRGLIYGTLAKVGKIPSSEVLTLWNKIMEDMYGDEQEPKQSVVSAAMTDEHITEEAKCWLKNTFKEKNDSR